MATDPFFFVSFSSRDQKYVREIISALKGQGLNVWDTSDIEEGIRLGGNLKDELEDKVDQCTHMISVLSRNSLDPEIGRYCVLERAYALTRHDENKLYIFPVVIGNSHELVLDNTCLNLQETFWYDFKLTPECIVEFTVKICKAIDKQYVPQIDAHPNLPFRNAFRKEIAGIDHSVKGYTDLMIIMGEFNENYKTGVRDIKRALFLVDYFIRTCEYRKTEYRPFYPWIVKAVCETDLGNYDNALANYEIAKTIHPENQDVIGGIGSVYIKTFLYQKAADCFRYILINNKNEDVTNARINLIIAELMMGVQISHTDEKFLFGVNIDNYADDLKTNILNAQAIVLRVKSDYTQLETHCIGIIKKKLHDTITIRLLQLSFINRGMFGRAREVIMKAIEESAHNSNLVKSDLQSFLDERPI